MADDKPPVDAPQPQPSAISAEPLNLPPIPLDGRAAKPAPTPASTTGKKEAEQKDSMRELFETIVFVVVLVLMLKTFLAEAFVIPTGSMADTLLGYHHKVICTQCGKENLYNASDEADPQDRPPQAVLEGKCENCGYWIKIRDVRPQGGQQ